MAVFYKYGRQIDIFHDKWPYLAIFGRIILIFGRQSFPVIKETLTENYSDHMNQRGCK